MAKFKGRNALVLGNSNPKVNEVVNILSKHFRKVQRAAGLTDDVDTYPGDHFNLIVVTDLMVHPPDADFINDLKKKFSRAKVLALFDDINQGIEISMRSVGLLFLGSYQHFGENSLHIFRSAFKPGIGRLEE